MKKIKQSLVLNSNELTLLARGATSQSRLFACHAEPFHLVILSPFASLGAVRERRANGLGMTAKELSMTDGFFCRLLEAEAHEQVDAAVGGLSAEEALGERI